MSEPRISTWPLLTCSPPNVGDDRDTPSDRVVLRSEHAAALRAQHGSALHQSPTPAVLAHVAANPQADPSPELARMMRACGLTAADVRKHGPQAVTVIYGLDVLVRATADRETADRRRGR